MKKTVQLLLLTTCVIAFAQTQQTPKGSFLITPEILIGHTAEANENFPDRKLQTQAILNFGWNNDQNTQEWSKRLKAPRTGLSLGYTDFGNSESLGSAITLMPFIEFNAFRKENLKIHVGTGSSYFTKKYDPITNPLNQGITTDLVWSFRLFMMYEILKTKSLNWRTGIGYFHHSNGHTRLPNQGLNSFLISISADINNPRKPSILKTEVVQEKTKQVYNYFSFRFGYGESVLALAFNDKKPVYTVAGSYGWVINKTFRLGGGAYYRFYQHYYDYIKGNESLVQDGEEFASYRESPGLHASNFGVFANGELLLNHIGIDVQLGFNIYKPAYKIDWRINEGWDNPPRDLPENWVLGEFTTKYKFKQYVSARMGLKYYLFGTNNLPVHNLYAGFHINANLGQADFTELSVGYVYNFNFKTK